MTDTDEDMPPMELVHAKGVADAWTFTGWLSLILAIGFLLLWVRFV